MSEPKPVGVPDIPDSADADISPVDSGGAPPEEKPNKLTALDDPDKKHRREMEKSKLRFAFYFVGVATAASIGIALFEYLSPGYAEKSGHGLSATSDALKLLATTSLGFVFGRTMNGDQ